MSTNRTSSDKILISNGWAGNILDELASKWDKHLLRRFVIVLESPAAALDLISQRTGAAKQMDFVAES